MPAETQTYVYCVNGQIFVSLAINGVPVPVSPDLMPQLSIVQNIKQMLPTIVLYLEDPAGNITKTFPIGDGTLIQVGIGPNQENLKNCIFRVVGVPNIQTRYNSHMLRIAGVQENVNYIFKMVDKSYKGPTSSVISTLAQECGLTPVVDVTNDDMVWLPNHQTISKYCHYLCERGWVDENSLMMLGVDIDKNLMYRNIFNEARGKGQSLYYYNQKPIEEQRPTYPIIDMRISQASGVANKLGGYGTQSGSVGLSGEYAEHREVQAKRLSPSFEINKEVKDQVALSKSRTYSLDSGNTHDNFMKAMHQNTRVRATFSTSVFLLTDMLTQDNLLDPVDISIIDPTSYQINDTFSGTYIIAAKTMMISGTNYYEKLQLMSQGKNSDPMSMGV